MSSPTGTSPQSRINVLATPLISRSNSFGSAHSGVDLLDGPDLLTTAPSGLPLAGENEMRTIS